MTEDVAPEPTAQPADPAAAPDLSDAPTDTPATPEPTVGTPRWWIPFAVAGGVLVVLLAASQVYLVTTLSSTQSDLSATRAELATLETQVADVNTAVGQVSQDVATLSDDTPQPAATPAPSLPSGSLPRWARDQADTAIGMSLGSVNGLDAYSGEALSIAPDDGTKRIWMVWAHWCPYCQEELPTLSAMHAMLADTYPDIEVATVTTSIDPSRGNPLDTYLAAEQFPFTVVVDDDLTLAGQMGVSAFPFWLVTSGDGTVLYRAAGYLDEAQILNLVTTLDGYEPQA
ncbi:MAG: redoxin domain-containing protein [Acidimicrobiia bacterium]